MVSVVQVILRGSQFLWTLLTTALIGNVIASAFSGNPSSINYAIFVSVFSWIVLLYGMAAAFVESLAMPIVLGAMDLLATIFTFIAGVVLAAGLNVHSCNNRVSYQMHISSVTATNKSSRVILLPTTSPTDLMTQRSAVVSFKRAQLSTGSSSLRLPHPWSWTSSTAVHLCRWVAVVVVSERVDHLCLKSKEIKSVFNSAPFRWETSLQANQHSAESEVCRR